MKGLQLKSEAFRTQTSIYDQTSLSSLSLTAKSRSYFRKKAASEMFNCVLNRPLKIMRFSRRSLGGEVIDM